jgi:hypothetical protein
MTTDDLDKTIELLNDMLQVAESIKDKLAITDRLLKCHVMKLKFTDEGKGGKFSSLDKPVE